MDKEKLLQDIKSFGLVGCTLLGLVILSTIFFRTVEGWDWIDAYYYTVVTVATVGYGDFTPQTPLGKIGATVVIMLGIGLFSTFITMLLKRRALKALQHRTAK